MRANCTKTRNRGLSLVEILIAVAVLAVITAIALPSPEKNSAKEEMRVAVENLQQAVYLARSTAMSKKTEVVMHIVSGGNPEHPDEVTFSFAKAAAGLDASALDQSYPFPPGVRLEASPNDVLFDSAGHVDRAARVALISDRDTGFNQRLLIE